MRKLKHGLTSYSRLLIKTKIDGMLALSFISCILILRRGRNSSPNMAVWISIHILIVLLTFLPVVPCSNGPDLGLWMQRDEPGGFIEYRSYSWTSVWSNVIRTPPYRTWLCLARKSSIFRCHKTHRHISMMILLLMLSGDVETNPGPVTRRNQQQNYGKKSSLV